MAIASRQQLIDYCLRRLGAPVLEINVADEQIEDRIDDAFSKFQEYHNEGTARVYHFHTITAQDVTNGYITLPESIIYVSRMLPIESSFLTSSNMFSLTYQMAQSDMHEFSTFTADLAYYKQLQQYMSLLDMTLNGTPQITFSRRMNRVYIWGDFVDQDLVEGENICLEVYQEIDPDTFTSCYNNTFMKDYSTALIKRQWGQNMSKFEGIQLPGGVTISGRAILEEANAEIDSLVEKMRLENEFPPDFLVG